MKVQTTVLLLCFLSGVFLYVVHAKPSPELMKELIALEKFLEKKDGSEGAGGQNENPGEKRTGENVLDSLLDQKDEGHQNGEQENRPSENEPQKPNNENNNNVGGEDNTADGSNGAGEKVPHADENEKPTEPNGAVPPAKPEESVAPENAEEGSGPTVTVEEAPQEQGGSIVNGGEGEGKKPQEGSRPSPSEGQAEKGRDQTFEGLDEVIRKIKDAVDKLSRLDEEFREQFQIDDGKFKELEDKDEQRKVKAKEKLGQLKTIVEEFRSAIGVSDTSSVGKKSIQENAPARSRISDTELLNIVQSLLTNN